jgi:5-methylcytosine-specific restriction endonuclease McrA
MRYYAHRAPITKSSLSVTTWVACIAIAQAVFAAYQLYQRWDPRERPDWNSADGRTVYDHIREFEFANRRAEKSVTTDRESVQRNGMYDGERHRRNGMYAEQGHLGNDEYYNDTNRPHHVNMAYVPTKFRRKRLTPRQRSVIMERTNYCCSMCGNFCPIYDRELNHRISLSSNLYRYYDLNDLSNYELLCRKCHGLETYLQRQRGEFKH